MKKWFVTSAAGCIVVFVACVKDVAEVPDPAPAPVASPVDFDPALVPYDSLSTYRFFEGAMAALQPSAGLIPFAPITPLFSDGAHKSRFLWMPQGVAAQYVNDSSVFAFPDGAVLIKNFWFDDVQPLGERRIIETRVMYRLSGTWHFAEYVWNDEQTEAVLDMNGSFTDVQYLDDDGIPRNVQYRLPAAAECMTCHKSFGEASPIGTKPQHLNTVFTYADGTANQLAKWSDVGYLEGGFPGTIETVAKWDDPAEDLTRRVRAYLDMNCAHCHREGGHCDYRPMRFAWHRTADLAGIGVCVPPHDPLLPQHEYIVTAGDTARSLLYFRLNSTSESVRMPLLGRTVIHEDAVQLIGGWIQQLSPPCD